MNFTLIIDREMLFLCSSESGPQTFPVCDTDIFLQVSSERFFPRLASAAIAIFLRYSGSVQFLLEDSDFFLRVSSESLNPKGLPLPPGPPSPPSVPLTKS